MQFLNKTGLTYLWGKIKEKISAIDVTDQYTVKYTKRYFKALYYPLHKKVEIYFRIDNIASGDWLTVASTTNAKYKNVEGHYDVAYGNAAQIAFVSITDAGDLQVYGKSGAITMASGMISFVLKEENGVNE